MTRRSLPFAAFTFSSVRYSVAPDSTTTTAKMQRSRFRLNSSAKSILPLSHIIGIIARLRHIPGGTAGVSASASASAAAAGAASPAADDDAAPSCW